MTKYSNIEIETAKSMLKKGLKWIGRNKSGRLSAYANKPSKVDTHWWAVGYSDCTCDYVPIFQNVKFEDAEPTSLEIIVHPRILDDAEKRYLKGVIKPFRDKVAFICKVDIMKFNNLEGYAFQHIVIGISNSEGIALPDFDSGTMYKGMKSGHGYTLEELGL